MTAATNTKASSSPVISSSNSKVNPKSSTSTPPKFIPNVLLFNFNTLLHVLAALLGIYLVPFGRSTPSESSFLNSLYDLLFTEKLEDFVRPSGSSNSFLGSALLATIIRPLNLVFDQRIRSLAMSKLPLLKLPEALIFKIGLYFHETQIWNLIVGRIIISMAFVLSLALLRSSLALKFKSSVISTIFSILSLATFVPFLTASRIQAQTFSMIILNFALAALFSGHYNRTFSLLTVNSVIFDVLFGSVLLKATFISSLMFLRGTVPSPFNPLQAILTILVTLPFAIIVTSVFDSLFYNKFIWPQGEVLLSFVKSSLDFFKSISMESVKSLVLESFKALSPENLKSSKTLTNLVIALTPALLVYIFGRKNRYTKVLLSIYSITISSALIFFSDSSNLSSTCTPLIVPLLVSTSIAFLGGIKSSNRLISSFTYIFLLGIVLPSIFWTFGRLHLEISSSSQFSGQALLAINSKILKEAKEGAVSRVHINPEISIFGANKFLQLTNKNVFYSTASSDYSQIKSFRPDYLISSPKFCPNSKAMKLFAGFDKVDLKKFKISEITRVGVFRVSPTCPTEESVESQLPLQITSEINDSLAKTFELLASTLPIIKKEFSSLKEQRAFISQYLGRFSHKKVSNSAAIMAYLYANLLEQL